MVGQSQHCTEQESAHPAVHLSLKDHPATVGHSQCCVQQESAHTAHTALGCAPRSKGAILPWWGTYSAVSNREGLTQLTAVHQPRVNQGCQGCRCPGSSSGLPHPGESPVPCAGYRVPCAAPGSVRPVPGLGAAREREHGAFRGCDSPALRTARAGDGPARPGGSARGWGTGDTGGNERRDPSPLPQQFPVPGSSSFVIPIPCSLSRFSAVPGSSFLFPGPHPRSRPFPPVPGRSRQFPGPHPRSRQFPIPVPGSPSRFPLFPGRAGSAGGSARCCARGLRERD